MSTTIHIMRCHWCIATDGHLPLGVSAMIDATFPYIYNFSLDTTDGHYMTRS